MASRAPKKAKPTAKVDTAVYKELSDIARLGYYNDLQPLVTFIQNLGLKRTLDFINSRNSADDMKLVSKMAQALGDFLAIINVSLSDESTVEQQVQNRLAIESEKDRISDFYRELFLHLRVFYKVFASREPLHVNSVIHLLLAVVEYNDFKVFNEFTDSFDFRSTAVHKLFEPTRDDFDRKIISDSSMRASFMEFWILLCSRCSSVVRKDLLTNYKLMGSFWKYLEMDRFEILTKVFKFLNEKVLNEPMFMRATKAKILNENCLLHVRPLFEFLKPVNDREFDNDDEGEFTTFKDLFNEFMDTLATSKNKGISFPENEFGAPLIINNVSFKINNKLLYVLLTTFRPWDTYLQMQFVMKVLNSNPELLAPYMHWIVSSSGGYHDPSLTSYWIGHTLLYTEILKSPLFPAKVDNISLFPLNSSIQSAILEYPNALVQQLGLQLILLQLKKLSSKGVTQAVIESVLSSLPPHSALVPFLLHDNKFLKITATQILTQWENIAPGSSSSAIVAIISKKLLDFDFNSSAFSGMELVLLDNYLSIQSNNDLKWWNKTGTENSFFTSLLKLSHLDTLRPKILRILQKLTRTSLAFNQSLTIEDPLLILLDTMPQSMQEASAKKLFNCIDETISRSIKTPYKYLDKSSANYEKLSIFVVVLFEQLKFIPEYSQETAIHKWLNSFVQGLVIIGESQNGIEKAAKDNEIDIKINLKSLNLKSRIMSKVDFAETCIIFNRYSNQKNHETNLFNAATKMGQFLTTASNDDPRLISYVMTPSLWTAFSQLRSKTLNEAELVSCYLLSEVLLSCILKPEVTPMSIFIYETAQAPLNSKSQSVISKFLFLLSDSQVESLTKSFVNDEVTVNAFKEAVKRSLPLKPDYKSLMQIESSEVVQILQSIPSTREQLEIIVGYPRFAHLFEGASQDTIDFLLLQDDLSDAVLYHVASSSSAIFEKYKSRIVTLAESLKNWKLSLKIVAAQPNAFDWNKFASIAFDHIKSVPKHAMIAEFVNFIAAGMKHSRASFVSQFSTWINRAMLYITKKFAESSTLSDLFVAFIDSIGNMFNKSSLFKEVSVDIAVTQFQVILSHTVWVTNTNYLSYLNKILLVAGSSKINPEKLLQLFVANEKMVLLSFPTPETALVRFESALIIKTLFELNPKACSTFALLERLVTLYLGSTRVEDVILKSVLISIEKRISKSWVNLVTGWNFLNEVTKEEAELVGSERLFIKDKCSLVVVLQKNFIKNTIYNINEKPIFPSTSNYSEAKSHASNYPISQYHDTIYDPEFLLLLIVSNDELVTHADENLTVNITLLMESELLRFVVTALANPRCKPICTVILHGVLKFLQSQETPMKDRLIQTIYVSSILHTIRVADHLTPIVWYIIGSFSSILANPGHQLYELTYQYLSSHPVFKQYDLPLYLVISTGAFNSEEAEGEVYFKQVHWMVDELRRGISSEEDLKALHYKRVLDWVLDLLHCKYVTTNLRNKILNLVYVIQTVDAYGPDLLVAQSGTLSTLHALKQSIEKDTLADMQLKLNIDEIALRFAIAGSRKRLAEFTLNDVAAAAKRVHLA